MKKRITIFIVFILIIFIIGFGYNKVFGHIVSHNFTIKDFSKPVMDTLRPKERGPYSAHIVEIKGETDDTIKLGFVRFVLNKN